VGYRLESEHLSDEVRRVAREEINAALEGLGPAPDRGAGIHEGPAPPRREARSAGAPAACDLGGVGGGAGADGEDREGEDDGMNERLSPLWRRLGAALGTAGRGAGRGPSRREER
jgi:hypothetical protein